MYLNAFAYIAFASVQRVPAIADTLEAMSDLELYICQSLRRCG